MIENPGKQSELPPPPPTGGWIILISYTTLFMLFLAVCSAACVLASFFLFGFDPAQPPSPIHFVLGIAGAFLGMGAVLMILWKIKKRSRIRD